MIKQRLIDVFIVQHHIRNAFWITKKQNKGGSGKNEQNKQKKRIQNEIKYKVDIIYIYIFWLLLLKQC